jgi:glycosyltransferase involved in cell wall biosynthesis
MRLALISGAFPPQFDGIGDHTWWLSQAIANRGHTVTVITSFAASRPRPDNVEVISSFDSGRSQTIKPAIRELVKEGRFDWLIVQYNPFSFGRRGFAPGLLSALRAVEIPIACMFHETFARPLWPWQHILMRLWQYPQFVFLVRIGDCHFGSTERWLAQVRRWARTAPHLLPVGSNLPLCRLNKYEAREKLGLSPDALILGVFGFAHTSKRVDWIGAAARRVHSRFPQAQVLSIGQLGRPVQEACGQTPVHDHGFLPAPEVSLRLRAMDLFLAPFSDGISARRGSVISAFQHGVPVCSTGKKHTDQFLQDLVSPALSLSPSNNKNLFAEAALNLAELSRQTKDLGHDLVEFHDQHFAWPVIADRMLAGLIASQSDQSNPSPHGPKA